MQGQGPPRQLLGEKALWGGSQTLTMETWASTRAHHCCQDSFPTLLLSPSSPSPSFSEYLPLLSHTLSKSYLR